MYEEESGDRWPIEGNENGGGLAATKIDAQRGARAPAPSLHISSLFPSARHVTTLHVKPLYTRRPRETTKGKEKEGKRGALVEELAFRLGRIRYPCVYNTIEGGGG